MFKKIANFNPFSILFQTFLPIRSNSDSNPHAYHLNPQRLTTTAPITTTVQIITTASTTIVTATTRALRIIPFIITVSWPVCFSFS